MGKTTQSEKATEQEIFVVTGIRKVRLGRQAIESLKLDEKFIAIEVNKDYKTVSKTIHWTRKTRLCHKTEARLQTIHSHHTQESTCPTPFESQRGTCPDGTNAHHFQSC